MFIIEFLLDTRHQFAHHFLFALNDFGVVKCYILCFHAIFVGVGSVVVLLGAVQQGLGGNAPHVQTRATQSILFKQYDIHSGL